MKLDLAMELVAHFEKGFPGNKALAKQYNIPRSTIQLWRRWVREGCTVAELAQRAKQPADVTRAPAREPEPDWCQADFDPVTCTAAELHAAQLREITAAIQLAQSRGHGTTLTKLFDQQRKARAEYDAAILAEQEAEADRNLRAIRDPVELARSLLAKVPAVCALLQGDAEAAEDARAALVALEPWRSE